MYKIIGPSLMSLILLWHTVVDLKGFLGSMEPLRRGTDFVLHGILLAEVLRDSHC